MIWKPILKEGIDEGTCPYCNGNDIDYGIMVPDGNSCYYPATCDGCKKEFREYYDLIFSGHWEEQNN